MRLLRNLILPLGFCLSLPAWAAAPTIQVERIEESRSGSSVSIKIGDKAQTIKLPIFSAKHLGQISNADGSATYLLFAARPCLDCKEDQAIFIGKPKSEKPWTFVYPGKVLTQGTRQPVLESRAFFGQCLSGNQEAYVVFQQERVDKRRRRGIIARSVLVVEPDKDHLKETLHDRRLPQLATAQRKVKQKLCTEIEGRSREMPDRTALLRPSIIVEEREEEDDEETASAPGPEDAPEAAAPAENGAAGDLPPPKKLGEPKEEDLDAPVPAPSPSPSVSAVP